MTLEIIDAFARLCDFQSEWKQFEGAIGLDTPFQTPEWLMTWWSHFGSSRLHVLTVRCDGKLQAVLPCFLHEWNGHRQLTLIGTGISDYLDPLLNASRASAIADLLATHLEQSIEWEVCNWQDLSADTPLRAVGPVLDDTPCSRIVLPSSFDDFLAARPSDLRRNLRRDARKAQSIGPVQFVTTTEADPDLLDALITLHGDRWRRAGQPGMIDSNHANGFLRAVSAALARRGMVRIFALRFQERVVSVILAFCTSRTIFAYLSGFDWDYEDLSFGRELLVRSFRFVHANGYRQWDFLRGEEPYKFDWGAERIPKCRMLLQREIKTFPAVALADQGSPAIPEDRPLDVRLPVEQ